MFKRGPNLQCPSDIENVVICKLHDTHLTALGALYYSSGGATFSSSKCYSFTGVLPVIHPS